MTGRPRRRDRRVSLHRRHARATGIGVALDRRRPRHPDRLAAGGHRAERRRQEHAAQDDRRASSRRSRDRSRSSAARRSCRPSGSPTCPQAELVDWSFPVTVGDVVMMGRVPLIGIGRSPGRADREAVAEALETVGMADERDRQIGALSGGQRRRVFLAKALAARPDLYLLDEPVTGVDVTTQEDLMRRPRGGGGGRPDGRRDDPRPRQRRAPLPPGGASSTAGSWPTGRPTSCSIRRSWPRPTAGTSSSCPAGDRTIIDDAHHHDEAPAGERHFHDGAG